MVHKVTTQNKEHNIFAACKLQGVSLIYATVTPAVATASLLTTHHISRLSCAQLNPFAHKNLPHVPLHPLRSVFSYSSWKKKVDYPKFYLFSLLIPPE